MQNVCLVNHFGHSLALCGRLIPLGVQEAASNWEWEVTSPGEDDSPDLMSSVSPASSGSPHTALSQCTESHSFHVSALILPGNTLVAEFNFHCNSTSCRMSVLPVIISNLSPVSTGDNCLLMGTCRIFWSFTVAGNNPFLSPLFSSYIGSNQAHPYLSVFQNVENYYHMHSHRSTVPSTSFKWFIRHIQRRYFP